MLQIFGIDHITLTVSDIERSERFYHKIFTYLGMKKQFSQYGFVCWKNKYLHFYLSEADIHLKKEKYNRYRVGLNHLSLSTDSRSAVDSVYQFLKRNKVKVVHAPQILKLPSHTIYYLTFEDPDGMRIEVGCFDGVSLKDLSHAKIRSKRST